MSATGSASRLRAGAMDRSIVIESVTLSNDSFGSGQAESWSTFATVPAEVLPMGVQERFISDQKYSSRTNIFNIRYLPGLLPTMRIQYDSLTWRILGVKEVNRQRGHEILAESII